MSTPSALDGGAGSYDVVVVGAGTAGIPCAVAAADAGARVLLLEKDSHIGGSLHLSGGHVSAAGTARQRARGIDDSPAAHLADIIRIGRGRARLDLVERLVERAPAMVDWLEDRGFDFVPETPVIVHGHEPYGTARTYFGRDEGLSILAVLTRELERALAETDLTLWKAAPVTDLRTAAGRVVGVTVHHRGRDTAVTADAVVLATGGFAADPELFAELEGAPLYSAGARTSTGDGIHLAAGVEAGLQGEGTYLPTFGGLPDARDPSRATLVDRQNLTVERPPLEIYVDRHGRRWVAEDEPSIDEKERALVTLPDRTFWTVFDDAMLAASRDGREMLKATAPDRLRALANVRHGIHAADSLTELAQQAGIDANGLVDTVTRYNAHVAAGSDPDHGRRHLPMPIGSPPFYAIRNHGITLVTFVGLDVDTDLAVRDTAGRVVPGLYAVGEVIGAGATCGNSFCSGMLVTPALTFGRDLGAALGAELGARSPGRAAAAADGP